MKVQSLDGIWQLKQLGTDEWLSARVPGGVHLDLMAANKIPDPFIADNELRVLWVAESDWEFRRTFRLDEAAELASKAASGAGPVRHELVFDGIDTIADVTLNGRKLGSPDNMFRTWRWDVTDMLRPNNEVVVYFHSPVRRAAQMEARRHLDHPKDSLPGGPYLRKAPCHFGWDWGPKLPNIGLWKGVRLESWHTARIGEVRLTQKVDLSARPEKVKATVWAEVRIERAPADGSAASSASATAATAATGAAPAKLTASVRIEGPDGRAHNGVATFGPGDTVAKVRIPIDRARLWWPNGLGEQPLYRVSVALSSEADANLDRREYQIGLRTLELRRKPDQWGESFTFVVNGVPVFAKGSNWIPADSFPARVTDAELERLLGAAAAANHNMIRVWGGGYYESEKFYDLCDRFGILVWQDFMFACSVYPLTDPAFVANVRGEIAEQVARLRHRACLALWCGNNEMERGWTAWGWTRPETKDLRDAYLRFFGRTLRGWVAAADKATPYWPSSPSSGKPLDAPIGDRAGDEHEWVVWHGLAPFETYRDTTWRFVSEFGFESLPAMATVKTFAPDPSDWNLGSPMMDQHQKCFVGNARILYYLSQHFRLPMDFESVIYLSQIQHAEAMRVGVEHWRRERARCSGALYWQLNDCWPVSSWASIDYYGRWKALHYVSRRFFAPVLLTCSVEAAGVVVAVTNDLPSAFRGQVRWTLEGLDGSVVSSGVLEVAAAGVATTTVGVVASAAGVAGEVDARRLTVCVAELWSGDRMLSRVVTPFAPDKAILLTPPRIKATLDEAETAAAELATPEADAEPTAAVDAEPTAAVDAEATATPDERRSTATTPAPAQSRAFVTLRSGGLARWVELTLDGADALFDDNYFDLPAGRDVVVGFDLPAGWTSAQARAALKVRSLIDTYQS